MYQDLHLPGKRHEVKTNYVSDIIISTRRKELLSLPLSFT